MTTVELLAVFRSLKKLHAKGLHEAAEEVIDEVIADAEASTRKGSRKKSSSATSDD
jgi:hypothetical protein